VAAGLAADIKAVARSWGIAFHLFDDGPNKLPGQFARPLPLENMARVEDQISLELKAANVIRQVKRSATLRE
jgi:hypothetical protein